MERLRGWASKLPGQILRVALILHGLGVASGCDHERIDKNTMSAALAWGPYFIAHAEIVLGLATDPLTDRLTERVLAWIRRENLECFSLRDAYQALKGTRLRAVADLDDPIRALEASGFVRRLEPAVATARRGGRAPSPRYEVDPLWDRA